MTCYINGVSYVILRDFSINDRLANKSATTIQVLWDYTKPVPQAGDIVQIFDGAMPIFFGVAGIPSSPEINTGNEKMIYKITCQNGNALLANRITNEAYQNATVADIVDDLFAKYIVAEGIQLGWTTNSDVTLEVYTAVNTNLQSTLNELAALVGGAWRITAAKEFYFYAQDELPYFYPGGPAIDRYTFHNMFKLQETTKSYKLRTVEHIVGATDRTSLQTEVFTYTGDGDTFTLGFPVNDKPTIKINGIDYTSHVGVSGLDDTDPNKYFYFSYNSNVISYRYSGLTPPLTPGATVTIIYHGIFNIRVTARNDAKIAELAGRYGTSGLIERVDNSNARTQRDAKAAADAYLLEYSEITHELTFRITGDELVDLRDLDVGHVVNVDLGDWNIRGKYVVTERTLTPDRADMTSAHAWQRMIFTYVMMDRDYLSGYGTVISNLQSDVAGLSIRENDIAIQEIDVDEYRNRFEQMVLTEGLPMYPTNGNMLLQYFMNWPGVLNGTTGLEMYTDV